MLQLSHFHNHINENKILYYYEVQNYYSLFGWLTNNKVFRNLRQNSQNSRL